MSKSRLDLEFEVATLRQQFEELRRQSIEHIERMNRLLRQKDETITRLSQRIDQLMKEKR